MSIPSTPITYVLKVIHKNSSSNVKNDDGSGVRYLTDAKSAGWLGFMAYLPLSVI